MRIEECKNINDYLIFCQVQSIEELTDEQVLIWAKSGMMGIRTVVSTDLVEDGMHGRKPDKKKAVQILKQAMGENKEFICSYILRESYGDPIKDNDNDEFFWMGLK